MFHVHRIYPGGKHGQLNVLMSKVNGSEGPQKRVCLTPVSGGYRDQHGSFVPKAKILFPEDLEKQKKERKRLAEASGVSEVR
jgi:hypothetical protein